MTETARTRRVIAVVGSIIVLATVLALVVPHVLAAQRVPQVPAWGEPEPDQPIQSEDRFSPPIEFPEAPEGCPKVQPAPPGVDVQIHWSPMIVVDGQLYYGHPTGMHDPFGVRAGEKVATITCDLTFLTDGGQGFVPGPWPDGTSTVLPEGEEIFAVVESPKECFLTATSFSDEWLFEAVNERGATAEHCVDIPPPG